MNAIEERGITAETIRDDETVQWMITTPLYHIGEQAHHVSSEIKDRYPEVPWFQAAGLRNRLVHDYESTDWRIISEIVFDELPPLVSSARHVLEDL